MSLQQLVSLLRRVWQKPLFRVAASLVILSLLLTQLPLGDLWQTLRQVSLALWLAVVAVFITGHAVGVFKWRLLINIGREKFSLGPVFRFYFAGLFANLFLPSIAGGDVVRAGLAIQHNPREKEAVLVGSLLDRLLDMTALGLLLLAGAAFSPLALGANDRLALLWLAILLATALASGLAAVVLPLPGWLPPRLVKVIQRVRGLLRRLVSNPGRALAGLSLALILQSVFVLVNAFLGKTVGIDLPLPVWFLVWPLAKLSATLPVSLGGLGVREAALAAFLGRFGIPMAASVGLGLLWQTVLFAGGAFGGIFYFLAGARTAAPAPDLLGQEVQS